MNRADIWMPLYIGDYLADTARLTTEQHGAYLLLIMDYWRNGPPPDNDEILQSITRFSKFLWKKQRPILEKYFRVEDGVWRHKRIDEEMAEALSSKEVASEKAKKAAEARWSKNDARSIPQALLEECPSPSPSPSKEKEPKPLPFADARFDEFWSEYPKKAAKPDAAKAFKKLKVDDDLFAAVMEGLELAKVSDQWMRENGKYIPHPASWLNKRRWEDEPEGHNVTPLFTGEKYY